MKVVHKSAWIHVVNRKVLFLRAKDKDMFYTPGGKREEGESNEDALKREVYEELTITLIPDSIKHLITIETEAHGKSEPTKLVMECYTADFSGGLAPDCEIEEMAWWTSTDSSQASEAGIQILNYLKEKDLID